MTNIATSCLQLLTETREMGLKLSKISKYSETIQV